MAPEASNIAKQLSLGFLHNLFFEPLPLLLRFARAAFVLVLVKVLQHLVEEASSLHRDRTGFVDQPRVVVVPVEARALEVVVERRRAEVADLHRLRVASPAVTLAALPSFVVRHEITPYPATFTPPHPPPP